MAHHDQTRRPQERHADLLPSRAPELNPVENVRQSLCANWLSNRVFETYDAIIEATCEAWRMLIAHPETNQLYRKCAFGCTSIRRHDR